MWTVAATNKKLKGPLGSYSGLTDVHLAHYFAHPSKKSHLKKANLITEDGLIKPESRVKIETLHHEKKKQFYDMLAGVIVQNAVHREGISNTKISNHLEDLSKIELVERIKVALKKRSNKVSAHPALFSSQSSPPRYQFGNSSDLHDFKNKISPMASSIPSSCLCSPRFHSQNSSAMKRCFSATCSSPYLVPLLYTGPLKCSTHPMNQTLLKKLCSKKRKRKRASKSDLDRSMNNLDRPRSEPLGNAIKLAVTNQQLTINQCRVTLCYHGFTWPVNCQKYISQDISIRQQHSGGTSILVYKGKVSVEETLTFASLRQEGYAFSIAVFVDGIRDLKLSSCCEYRYLRGRRLGGANGCFSIHSVEGGSPCFKCQYRTMNDAHFQLTKKAATMTLPTCNRAQSAVDGTFTDFLHAEVYNDVKEDCMKDENNDTSINESINEKLDKNSSQSTNSSDVKHDDVEEILDATLDLSQLDIEEDSFANEAVPEETHSDSLKSGSECDSICESQSSINSVEEVDSNSGSSIQSVIEPEKPFNNMHPDSSSDEGGVESHIVQAAVHAAC